ncbi:peptide chain release factor N(5)-glutamine methyltransferase [Methylomarinum vadi]|uniref:peptide chain release factor N(5)-glutamine methyltransferase n=1 Tax=Methylomarinum vadi TaxID=438855 RepID=UPI0004DF84C2|nr:peptide chain release factor N(5)-glutamine methyltransferase [Methylomarinum vadi]
MTNADIQSLLADACASLEGISESPLLDAEILLCHCLHKPRTYLRTWPEKIPTQAQREAFRQLLAQRRQGLPIAYIVGKREFWSREFEVTPDVLIPRPDTELLVELSLQLIPPKQPARLIDLGTGSGIIAITLAAERPEAQVTASDRSQAALKIAHANAERYRLRNIRFVESNWFEAIAEHDFDLVVSNPPYIAADDPHLRRGDVRHEPEYALISPEQGLRDIRTLAQQARQHLNKGGHLLIEHGYNQQHAVQEIFASCHYQQIETHRDLSGNPRVTSGIWRPD